jgi:hypothetical protein
MTRKCWILLAILILGCLAEAVIVSAVCGQCADGSCRVSGPVPTQPHPAVCRIDNRMERFGNLGTGTLIDSRDGKGLVLTCAHLFREGTGNITVKFADGSVHQARLLDRDPTWDLAALEIDAPVAQPVPIADGYPRQGDAVKSCGYGPNGQYACNSGQVLGYTTAQGTSSFEWFDLTGAARQGDSGGPVFDRQGRLCGVLWGTDGRTIGATYCGRIRKFLQSILGRHHGQPAIAGGGMTPPQGGNSGGGSTDAAPPPLPAVPLVPVTPQAGNQRCDGIAAVKAQVDALRSDLKGLKFPEPVKPESLSAAVQAGTAPLTAKVDALIAVLSKPASEAPAQPQAVPASTPQQTTPPAVSPLISDGLASLAVKGLVAVGVPGGLAVGLAGVGWMGLKLWRRRGSKVLADVAPTITPQQPQQQTVIVREAKPLPQVVVRESEYVPVEVPTKRQRAMEMAMDHFMQKYPGAASAVETLKTYTDQFESGLKSPN